MDQTEIIIVVLSIGLNILLAVGLLPAIRKLLSDLVVVSADGKVDKNEFDLLVSDGLNIFNIIKHLFGK